MPDDAVVTPAATLSALADASAAAAARFRHAAAVLDDGDLRRFFAERAHDAEVAAEDLRFFVSDGDASAPHADPDREASGNDPRAVLAACEAGESALLARYIAAFESPLPADAKNVVRSQLDGVQRDRDRLRALLESGTEARPATP
jgi:hypothetical protein